MKKSLLTILLLFVMQNVVSATENCNYDLKCEDIKQTPSSALTFLSKITGMDFLKVQSTETALEKYILKKTSNKVDIELKAKSVRALNKGEFEKISATAPKLSYKSFSVSDFNAQTLCPYNRFLKQGSSYSFPYDIPAEFSAVITNDDLQKANSELAKDDNNKIKISAMGVNLGSITIEKCFLKDSKIHSLLNVSVPFISTKTEIGAGLTVKDGELVLADISNEKLSINLNNFLPQIMQNSPLFLMFNLSKNTNGMVNISDVKINDDKIYVKGIFIIPKNCDITE